MNVLALVFWGFVVLLRIIVGSRLVRFVAALTLLPLHCRESFRICIQFTSEPFFPRTSSRYLPLLHLCDWKSAEASCKVLERHPQSTLGSTCLVGSVSCSMPRLCHGNEQACRGSLVVFSRGIRSISQCWLLLQSLPNWIYAPRICWFEIRLLSSGLKVLIDVVERCAHSSSCQASTQTG